MLALAGVRRWCLTADVREETEESRMGSAAGERRDAARRDLDESSRAVSQHVGDASVAEGGLVVLDSLSSD